MISLRSLSIISLLIILIGLPRFAHHTPDSRHYIHLAQYIRGELPREQLLGPFAYRVALPFLAAAMPPADPGVSMAFINVAATAGACFLFIPYLRRLDFSEKETKTGMFLLIFSFPSFNYASGVMSDPAGFFMFMISLILLLNQQYLLLSLSVSLGVLVRESLLTVVLISALDILLMHFMNTGGKKGIGKIVLTLAGIALPPLLIFLFVRMSLFPDIPTSFHWGLSLKGFIRNITEPKIGWLTFAATLGPMLLLMIYGLCHRGWADMRKAGEREKIFLLSVATTGMVYLMYSNSIATAYMSGRFVWPFYSVLIPAVILFNRESPLFNRRLGPAAERIF